MRFGICRFFCFNELVQLRRCDFHFEDSFMRIFVQRSKTDVYRDGAWVVIAKTFKCTCPCLLTQRYFSIASFSAESEDLIFRQLTFCSGDKSYKFRGSDPLSYSRAREIVLSTFDAIGLPKKIMVFIALEQEVPLLQLMHKSPIDYLKGTVDGSQMKPKDGYIKGNIQSLLSVSLSLGILFFFLPFFYVRIQLVLTHPNSGCLVHDKCFIYSVEQGAN